MKSLQSCRKTPGPVEGIQVEQCDIEEACFMKSNLKFAINICDVQQNVKFDIPRAAKPYALAGKAWGSSYLYYLLSGPHMLLGNIANHGKPSLLRGDFLLFVVLS